MASNTAAKEVLGMAKNRMQKFYNPNMYEEPARAFIQLHAQTVTAPPTAAGSKGRVCQEERREQWCLADDGYLGSRFGQGDAGGRV